MGATLTEAATVLGVGRATVSRWQADFRQAGTPAAPANTVVLGTRGNWGGRRHALLTVAEEEEFLAPWLEQAKAGGVLVMSPVRAALAQRVGRPVKASVVYRLLTRHGWRKVTPDTRHPTSNPHVQEEWKKHFPKRWQPS